MSNFSDFFPSADAPVTSVHARFGDVVAVGTDYAAFYAPLVHTHSEYALVVHSHAIVDVTGLQDALDGKAPTVHTHVKADITDFAHTHTAADLPATMPPSAHTHLEADITDLDKYTKAEVDAIALTKEDAIAYGTPDYMAVSNATSDGFNFVPQPDFEFYRLRGSVVPYTGVTPNGFADTVGDNVVTELVADVAPAGIGDPSGATYRCQTDLGSVVIAVGDPAVNVTEGDLLFWSGDSGKWLHIIQEVSFAVDSLNNKTGAVTIAGATGIDVTDGGGSIINVAVTPGTYAPITHTHTIADVTDLQAALDGKAALVHTHVEADITDLDKYTVAEVDAALALKADAVHTHVEADITDLDKYTQAEVDALLGDIVGGIQYQELATSISLVADTGYLCDSTLAALSLVLPVAVDNAKIEVLDNVGQAGTNNITILPNGTDTIMGGTQFDLTTNFQGVELVKIGTDWKFIGGLGESANAATAVASNVAMLTALADAIDAGNSTALRNYIANL